jgi:hypothetical protein
VTIIMLLMFGLDFHFFLCSHFSWTPLGLEHIERKNYPIKFQCA